MLRALYPGSFDPVTNGHVDIITRAAGIFDEVVVTVFRNSGKEALFTAEERVAMLAESTSHLSRVRVDSFSGLVVEYARQVGASVLLRGLRAALDFDYEFQMALMNRQLDPGIESFFMLTSTDYSFLSSTLVKELAHFGGPVSALVPPGVERRLRDKFPALKGGR